MFHKREPKFKKTSPDDPWIVRTWQTPRGRASLKLAVYGLFIISVLILIVVKTDRNPKVYKSTYTAIKKDDTAKIADLKENNFAFRYTITINDLKTLYYGNKMQNLESGFKEDQNGIVKYLKENDKVYKIGLTDKEEITNLYEGINLEYLNLNYIFDLINDKQNEVEGNKQTYHLDNNIVIEIITDNLNIKKITIQENSNLYELEYDKIGKISKNDIEN